VASLGTLDGKPEFLLDDRIYAPCGADWELSWPLTLSEDESVVACRATSQKTQKTCIVVDGRRGEEFDRVGPPALSRDGKRVAYRVQLGERCFVVVGNERGPDGELMSDPAISADGNVVAYAARREGRWRLVVGTKETPLDHQPSVVFLSADGRSVGYWYMESGASGISRIRVVVDGKAGEPFDLVTRPVFSPDGRRVTYGADDGKKQFVVIGDRKIEVVGRAGDPVFSPDGRKVGYGARIGREIWWKILDLP